MHGARTSEPRQGSDPSAANPCASEYIRVLCRHIPQPPKGASPNLARGFSPFSPGRAHMTTHRRSRAVGAGLRPAPTVARHRARARPRPRDQGRILSRGQFIGLQLSFELTFLLANCFWWVGGGRSPPPTHQKLFLCTGRERRNPAKARTRPPPGYDRVSSVNRARVGRHDYTSPYTNGRDARPCARLNRQSLIVTRYSLADRTPRPRGYHILSVNRGSRAKAQSMEHIGETELLTHRG